MPGYETYAKRQKRLRGELPDVYIYDQIPDALRVQLVQIVEDHLGVQDDQWASYANDVANAYDVVVKTLRKDLAVFHLPPLKPHVTDKVKAQELREFLLWADVDNFLSATELICRVLDAITRMPEFRNRRGAPAEAREAISEINIGSRRVVSAMSLRTTKYSASTVSLFTLKL